MYLACWRFDRPHDQDSRVHLAGCSKWPSSKAAASEGPRRTLLGYVEGLNDASTKPADFFSILLDVRFEARRRLVEHGGGGAREGFVVGMVEGINAELDQAGRQQVEEFF